MRNHIPDDPLFKLGRGGGKKEDLKEIENWPLSEPGTPWRPLTLVLRRESRSRICFLPFGSMLLSLGNESVGVPKLKTRWIL